MAWLDAYAGGAGRAVAGIGEGARASATDVKRAATEIEGLSKGIESLGTVAEFAKRVLSTIAVATLAKQFVEVADSANLMAARLKLATTSIAEFAQAQQSIYAIAQSNNVALKETSALYARIADPVRKLGGTARETAGIVEALGASLKISGASSQESAAAILQFSQALASGRLQGDELRSLAESAPRFMKALADGIGVSTGALKELGSEGQLTSDIVGNALLKSLAQLRTEATGIGDSVGGSFQRLANDALQTISALDQTFGITREIATGFSALGALVHDVGNIFREDLSGGAASASSAFDSFSARVLVLGTVLETVSVVAITIGSLLKGIGIGIASVAADLSVVVRATTDQLAALKSGNFAEMPKIAGRAIEALASIQRDTGKDLGQALTDYEKNSERALGITQRVLQARDALKLGASIDSSGSDRKFDTGFSALKAAADDKELLEVRLKLAGVNKSYLESLSKLQKSYEDGRTPLGEYQRLVSELATETFRSSTTGKEQVKAMAAGARAADEANKALKEQADLLADLSGVNKNYLVDLEKLVKVRATGAISEARYVDLVTALIEKQPGAARSMRETAKAAEDEAKAFAKATDEHEKLIDVAQRAAATAELQVKAAREEGAEIGLTVSALAQLRQARADEAASALILKARQAEDYDASGRLSAIYREQAEAIQELARQKSLNTSLKALDDAFDPTKAQSFGDAISNAFGGVSDSIKGALNALDSYGRRQAEIAKLTEHVAEVQRASKDAYDSGDIVAAAKLGEKAARDTARIQEEASRNQLKNYAELAGATKSFFSENSRGYRALEAVEKGFRIAELAMTLKNTAAKILGLTEVTAATAAAAAAQQTIGATVTATSIAQSQATGAAAVAPAIAKEGSISGLYGAAAMAAVLAALGYASAGRASGSSVSLSTQRQATQGTGTILGDSAAKSDSIANALEALEDSAKIELTTQSNMLRSLRSIDSGINGLANAVARTVGLTSGNTTGIQTGVISQSGGLGGNLQLGLLSPDLALIAVTDKLAQSLPLIGGVFTKLANLIGGSTSNTVTDSGLTIGGKLSDLIRGLGVGNFANVTTHTSGIGGLFTDDKNTEVGGQVDAALTRQFSLIFTSIVDSVGSAADALGRKGKDFDDTLSNFVVTSLDRISLRGLTGTALTDAISAALSSASDQIAQAALPGLDDFQKIGEGYLSTVVRLASGVESAGYALERFGLSAVDFGNIINKQAADLGAEIFRQSVLQQETQIVDAQGRPSRSGFQQDGRLDEFAAVSAKLSGVGQIISSLSGSLDDISSVYRSLLDVRDVMKSVGSAAIDLSAAMLRGAGGLEALKGGLDSYLDKFFTDSEKTAAATARLGERFAQIGVALPDGNAAFRKLVEGIDTSSEAGQLLYGQVINLAGAFSDLYPLAQQTAAALDLVSARRAQEIRILELTGDAAGALAAKRADEITGLQTQGYDDAYIATQRYIYSLEDAADAAQKAATAAQAQAAIETAIANERAGLQRQLLQVQGNTAALRALDRDAINESNRGIYDQIQALNDLQAAQTAATQAAQEEAARVAAIASERSGLERQLLTLQGDTTSLRALDRAALNESNRSIFDNIQALTDQQAAQAAATLAAQELEAQIKAVADERYGIETAILSAQGNTAALRERELAALNPANQALRAFLFTLEDAATAAAAAKAIADERFGIESEILNLQGDTVALRARELAALSPANQALKEQVFLLEDAAAAAEAAKALVEAWKSLTDNLIDEAKRVRAEMAGGSEQGFASLQARFALTTAQARAGDQVAASALPELSQALLKAAQDRATSQIGLARVQGATAASLEQTARLIGQQQSYDTGLPVVTATDSATPIRTTVAPAIYVSTPQTAYAPQRTDDTGLIEAIERVVTKQTAELREELRTGNLALIPEARGTRKVLEKWDADGLPNDFIEANRND